MHTQTHTQTQHVHAQEEEFERREEALATRDKALQAQLVDFSRFLSENETKRQRVTKRAAEDRRAAAAADGEGWWTLHTELDSL